MTLKQWATYLLIGFTKFALRTGLLLLFIPISSAAEAITAPDRAIANFQAATKKKLKKAAPVLTDSDDPTSYFPKPDPTPVPKHSAPTTVAPTPIAAPFSNTPAAAPIVSAPVVSSPIVSSPVAPAPSTPVPLPQARPPSADYTLPSGNSPTAPAPTAIKPPTPQTSMPPVAPLDDVTPTSNNVSTATPQSGPTFQSSSNATIAPTQRAPGITPRDMTTYSGRSQADVDPEGAATEATPNVNGANYCADGSCNKNSLGKITLPMARPKQAVARQIPAPATVRCTKENCSCGQRELLAAAKRLAPHRDHSIGLCAPSVSDFVRSVEAKYPGFDNPRMIAAGQYRYPTRTRYGGGIIGSLEAAGWTKFDKSNGVTTPEQAPIGSVVIFGGPLNSMDYVRCEHCGAGKWVGHTAVKGDDGLWYTDGRTVYPSVVNRYFQAAFIPGPKQNEKCGDYAKNE